MKNNQKTKIKKLFPFLTLVISFAAIAAFIKANSVVAESQQLGVEQVWESYSSDYPNSIIKSGSRYVITGTDDVMVGMDMGFSHVGFLSLINSENGNSVPGGNNFLGGYDTRLFSVAEKKGSFFAVGQTSNSAFLALGITEQSANICTEPDLMNSGFSEDQLNSYLSEIVLAADGSNFILVGQEKTSDLSYSKVFVMKVSDGAIDSCDFSGANIMWQVSWDAYYDDSESNRVNIEPIPGQDGAYAILAPNALMTKIQDQGNSVDTVYSVDFNNVDTTDFIPMGLVDGEDRYIIAKDGISIMGTNSADPSFFNNDFYNISHIAKGPNNSVVVVGDSKSALDIPANQIFGDQKIIVLDEENLKSKYAFKANANTQSIYFDQADNSIVLGSSSKIEKYREAYITPVETCTVTYHFLNNPLGYYQPSDQQFACGESIYPQYVSISSDYDFYGWYDNSALTGNTYDSWQSYTINTNMDFYGTFRSKYVTIDQNGLNLPEGVDSSTISYNSSTKTLTLNNYNDISIKISDDFDEFNINLQGSSSVDGDINSSSPITISGSGILNADELIATDLTIEEGSLNVAFIDTETYTQNGGTVNIGGQSQESGIKAGADIIINDGVLNIAVYNNGLYADGDIYLNGGNVAIDTYDSSSWGHPQLLQARVLYIKGGVLSIDNTADRDIDNYLEVFIMNGGEFNATVDSIDPSIFVLNDGNFNSNIQGENAIDATLFNQNGGSMKLKCNEAGRNIGCLSAYTIIFNGGTADIRTTDQTSSAIYVPEYWLISSVDDFEKDIDMSDEELSTLITKNKITFPKTNDPASFNGGDILLSSSSMAVRIDSRNCTDIDHCGYNGYIDFDNLSEDWGIHLGENMITDPTSAAVRRIMTIEDSEYDQSEYLITFSDGEALGDIEHGEFNDKDQEYEISGVEHALTSIHIYESKDEPPVPSADDKDEENPNTLDSKIVIILAAVASSIAAEGIIIGDLVRKLYNYKKALSSNFPTYPQY